MKERFRNPIPTVDVIIERDDGVILIERKNPPEGWAIPGGFVDYGESLESAAMREALEETSMKVTELRQFHVYSEPGRDPRFHTVSAVFVAVAEGEPCAGDDAKGIGVFREGGLPEKIAFDHERILSDYFEWKRKGTLPCRGVRVLFACVGNSCRSIMAQALFNHYSRQLNLPFEAESAGTFPQERIKPLALKVLGERGLDLFGQVPRKLDPTGLGRFHRIIAMGCLSGSFCPRELSAITEDWQVPDPFARKIDFYREVLTMIDEKVLSLIGNLMGMRA